MAGILWQGIGSWSGFGPTKYRTTADHAGNWEITLPPQAAGGPFDLTLKGKNEIVLRDILFGDVWFCSGQSNMVTPMERVKEKYPGEIANAQFPEIRNFFIATVTDLQEAQDDLPSGKWMAANPQDVLAFGAVSYFFAQEIHEQHKVPIGIINASVGGTPIEAWISEEGLKDFPDIEHTIQQNKDTTFVNEIIRKAGASQVKREEADRGLLDEVKWFDPAYIPKGWKKIYIPGYWEDQGLRDLNGVVWYRREIDLPASMTGMPAKLFMGRIIDADHVYVNGTEIGNTTYQYPPRRYNVEPGILKPGKNTIVIRVTNTNGKGGFVPDKPYFLSANQEEIDLKGEWAYKVGDVFKPVTHSVQGFSFQNQPTALYNAMVAPLKKQAIKGFLWYQGESNAGNPGPYHKLLPALIQDWRTQWQDDQLPFLYVQLPNYMDRTFLPAESKWAELREAQLKSLSVANTAMAVTIDLGEWNDVHPLNKKEVGHRLALGARYLVYGEKELVWSGPIYRSHSTQGNQMTVHFDHAGSGLISLDEEPLCQFAIAGADRVFEWAEAEIVNETVVVSSKSVSHPVYLRYAWSDNPEGANLYNKEGLPASPFQIVPVSARFSGASRDSIQALSQADYQLMLEQLDIDPSEMRPGPSGNPADANAANTDESKAKTYDMLPDPLVFNNGDTVRTAGEWETRRRAEITELFDREIYGRVPADVPGVTWEIVSVKDTTDGAYPVRIKQLIGHVDNAYFPEISVDIELVVGTPGNADTAVPVITEFGFNFTPAQLARFRRGPQTGPSWTQQLLAKGWGYAILVPGSIQADHGAGLTRGIIGLTNRGATRTPEQWGSLRAWAWGASRAVDYFETDPDVDASRLGITGLSRYGKAAVVTMAYEPRFAIGFIGSSGAGGTKLLRRNLGEQVENLASSGEYHWFAGNFIKYAGPLTKNDLPVEAHQLVALCAPRPVFISSGSASVEGQWVDARGMFLGGMYAGPVYRLLGKNDMGAKQFPAQETTLTDGEIAFRQHEGGHTTGPNWPYFIRYASRYFE
ncbi:MAG: sialate O-acetylesterase [Bacteroidales bacterium]